MLSKFLAYRPNGNDHHVPRMGSQVKKSFEYYRNLFLKGAHKRNVPLEFKNLEDVDKNSQAYKAINGNVLTPNTSKCYNKNLRYENFLALANWFIRKESRSPYHWNKNSPYRDRARLNFTPSQFHRFFPSVSLRTVQRYFKRAFDEGQFQFHSLKIHKKYGTRMAFYFSKKIAEEGVRRCKATFYYFSRVMRALEEKFLKGVTPPEEKKQKNKNNNSGFLRECSPKCFQKEYPKGFFYGVPDITIFSFPFIFLSESKRVAYKNGSKSIKRIALNEIDFRKRNPLKLAFPDFRFIRKRAFKKKIDEEGKRIMIESSQMPEHTDDDIPHYFNKKGSPDFFRPRESSMNIILNPKEREGERETFMKLISPLKKETGETDGEGETFMNLLSKLTEK